MPTLRFPLFIWFLINTSPLYYAATAAGWFPLFLWFLKYTIPMYYAATAAGWFLWFLWFLKSPRTICRDLGSLVPLVPLVL